MAYSLTASQSLPWIEPAQTFVKLAGAIGIGRLGIRVQVSQAIQNGEGHAVLVLGHGVFTHRKPEPAMDRACTDVRKACRGDRDRTGHLGLACTSCRA